MLRAFILVLLMIPAAPAFASESTDSTVTAQQKQAPQPAPRRDCEKQQDGIS